jgi:hypothetical protein
MRIQWWIALATTAGVFLLSVALYLSARRIPA